MKSTDLQNVVLSKFKIGEKPTKISRDLNGQVSRATITRWYRQLREQGFINLKNSRGRKRSARSSKAIRRAKPLLKSKARKSVRKLARKLAVSTKSAHRIHTYDLRFKAYTIVREPRLTDKQMWNRVQFSNWVRHNFTKSPTKHFRRENVRS